MRARVGHGGASRRPQAQQPRNPARRPPACSRRRLRAGALRPVTAASLARCCHRLVGSAHEEEACVPARIACLHGMCLWLSLRRTVTLARVVWHDGSCAPLGAVEESCQRSFLESSRRVRRWVKHTGPPRTRRVDVRDGWLYLPCVSGAYPGPSSSELSLPSAANCP